MKVVVIGTGYVGLVSGACFANIGHEVVCVDKDQSKIDILNAGDVPIYEPGLADIVISNKANGRLSFSTSLADVIDGAEVVLLAVGTPTDEKTGRADLKYVLAAVEEIAKLLKHKTVIVTKSTVPVGTGEKVKKIIEQYCNVEGVEVASNPEFLREGVAINDFRYPDRVIIGANTDSSKSVMQNLYSTMIGEGIPVLFTNIATAELIKYSSNAFLATKIAFANEISDICEGVGANVDLVIKGMGMDSRIGAQYMQPGPGYGGSCFPKDTLALTYIAEDAGFPTKIVESVIASNDDRRQRMVSKIIAAANGDISGKKIAVLGLTFKADTDDMRYSPSLVIVPQLLEKGASVTVYDPEGMDEAKKEMQQKNINWCKSKFDAMSEADILVILTEWDEFKKLDLSDTKQKMNGNIIVDLRNIIDAKNAKNNGFEYISLGRS